MSQNLEIEFKNMLSKDEYHMLLDFFDIPDEQVISQENHYFDTPSFHLKDKGAALRIRQKRGKFEMTLKQPYQDGLLETNQNLSQEEAALAILTGKLPSGTIKELISKMNISFSEIEYFGSLVTKRAEIKYRDGLLVFDHSYYLNKEDFELEYEVENYQQGKQIFFEFLDQHNIPQRKTDNKIKRFYLQKLKEK
ncbi:MAG: CYTH domain-containing protein [Bacillota bacterium]|nr:CYTH domain-containing protein [Bacillota bacterium]MDP4154211.1 CYTH domain-containing protein [Bacillota bacterium]